MTGAFVAAFALAIGYRSPVVPLDRWMTGGPAGLIISVAASGADGSVYAGTLRGLYRSVDSGRSWKPILEGVVGQVAVAPSNPNVLCVAVSQQFSALGVLRTTDGGENWTPIVGHGFVAIDPTDAETLYVSFDILLESSTGEMVKSTDGGTSWTLLPLRHVDRIAVDPVEPSVVYAATSAWGGPSRVYKSTDGGSTWNVTPLAGTEVAFRFLAVDGSSHTTVYAGGPGFYRSDDSGASWLASEIPPPDGYSFAIDLADPAILYVGSFTGVFTTEDRGLTWSKAPVIEGETRTLAVTDAVDGTELYAGTTRGVFLSGDSGQTWNARSAGILGARTFAVAVSATNTRRAYALASGFSRTDDGGQTWIQNPWPPTADSGALAADPTNADIVYASGASSSVLRSADGGVTWSATAPIPGFVTSIAIDSSGQTTLYVTDGRPWRSASRGLHWKLIDDGIGPDVRRIAVSAANPAIVYAANDELFRSVDGGESWVALAAYTAAGGGTPQGIATDPAHAGTVYVVDSPGQLWRSADRGASWQELTFDQGAAASALAIDGSGRLFVALYRPSIHGTYLSWPVMEESGGFKPVGGRMLDSNGIIRSLAVEASGSGLYVATESYGVWQVDLRHPRVVPPR